MSKLRLVVLESDDADGHAIGAIVGVLREMQIGRLQPQVTSASVEAFVEPLREEAAAPVLSAPKARKQRVAKAAASAGETPRGKDVVGTILAALRKNSRPDLQKLALACYGEASPHAAKKVQRSIWRFCFKKLLRDNKDGSYTVL